MTPRQADCSRSKNFFLNVDRLVRSPFGILMANSRSASSNARKLPFSISGSPPPPPVCRIRARLSCRSFRTVFIAAEDAFADFPFLDDGNARHPGLIDRTVIFHLFVPLLFEVLYDLRCYLLSKFELFDGFSFS